MMNRLIRCAALAGAVSLGACEDALEVTNPNDPETERVLATPKDAEALLGGYYRRHLQAFHEGLGNVWGMAETQSFANYSSLANNCMNARSGIPRPTNNNDISNTCGGEQQRVYFVMNEVTRVASNVLHRFNQPGYTLNNEAADHRARAFAEFLRGVSLGYIALVYDSSAVVVPGQDALDAGPLLGYMEVMDASLSALSNAIAHAQLAEDAGDLEIPFAWIPADPEITTMAEFIELITSYRARFRANVARTPAERAAVNWAEVISDAQNGIAADFEIVTDQQAGPVNDWVDQFHSYGLWHQMPPWIIGAADTSGSYASWIALPLDDRGTGGAFFMVTPDLRFPQGESRSAQQAEFAVTSCDDVAPCERYFRNRPSGNDQGAGVQWGQSNYDFVRFHTWSQNGGEGPLPFMTVAEMNMLEAEGHIRAGAYGAAAALINLTRTTNGGLPAVTGTADGGLAGSACVPKRAVNAAASGGGTVTCGDLMEAMKWEKRLETLETHPMAWFLDSRGWGDLPEGTPTHWAPPYQDLQARRAGIYSIGIGTTGGGAAGPSTYGW